MRDGERRTGAAATMTGTSMRCLAGDELGPPERFRLCDCPMPEPGPDEVRLRIEATALGFVDGLIAAGQYQLKPQLPYIPGGEIVGTVDQLGAGVAGVRVGDRVASWQLARGGGAAEFVVAPVAGLIPVPTGLAPESAAAMLLDYLTASYALFDRGGLRAGQSVLVLGAGGGVGGAAVQLAARAGADVIAAAGSAEKRTRALGSGARAALDYLADGWRDDLRRLLPGGVDLVVDPVGGESSERAFRSLARGGGHLVLGFAAGTIPRLPLNLPLLKSASLIGVDVRYFHDSEPHRAASTLATILQDAAKGGLRPPMVDVHPLDKAAAAFASLADRNRPGKLVIIP